MVSAVGGAVSLWSPPGSCPPAGAAAASLARLALWNRSDNFLLASSFAALALSSARLECHMQGMYEGSIWVKNEQISLLFAQNVLGLQLLLNFRREIRSLSAW